MSNSNAWYERTPLSGDVDFTMTIAHEGEQHARA